MNHGCNQTKDGGCFGPPDWRSDPLRAAVPDWPFEKLLARLGRVVRLGKPRRQLRERGRDVGKVLRDEFIIKGKADGNAGVREVTPRQHLLREKRLDHQCAVAAGMKATVFPGGPFEAKRGPAVEASHLDVHPSLGSLQCTGGRVPVMRIWVHTRTSTSTNVFERNAATKMKKTANPTGKRSPGGGGGGRGGTAVFQPALMMRPRAQQTVWTSQRMNFLMVASAAVGPSRSVW